MRKLIKFYNIWIELINIAVILLVVTFSISQVRLVTETGISDPAVINGFYSGAAIILMLWVFIFFQIPVLLFLATDPSAKSSPAFGFALLKMHWIRTGISMIFVFISAYNLQYSLQLDYGLSVFSVVIGIFISVVLITAGLYLMNRKATEPQKTQLLLPVTDIKSVLRKNPYAILAVIFSVIIFIASLIMLAL